MIGSATGSLRFQVRNFFWASFSISNKHLFSGCVIKKRFWCKVHSSYIGPTQLPRPFTITTNKCQRQKKSLTVHWFIVSSTKDWAPKCGMITCLTHRVIGGTDIQYSLWLHDILKFVRRPPRHKRADLALLGSGRGPLLLKLHERTLLECTKR